MALTLTDIYNKLTWKNSPDHTTPINEDNLNHIENGIKNNNTGLRAAETAINNLSTAVGNTQNLDTSSKEVVGAVNELNNNLTAQDNLTFRFATDGEGNHGYLGADDSFIPFHSNSGFKFIGGILHTPFTNNGSQYVNNGLVVMSYDIENGAYKLMHNGSINNDYMSVSGGTVTAKVNCKRLNTDGSTSNISAGTSVSLNWYTQIAPSSSYILAFE